jgi:predicted secreted protein
MKGDRHEFVLKGHSVGGYIWTVHPKPTYKLLNVEYVMPELDEDEPLIGAGSEMHVMIEALTDEPFVVICSYEQPWTRDEAKEVQFFKFNERN